MEEIFIDILNRLATIEGISYIDEDWGQLETMGDSYPITFPAILIDAPSVTWSNCARNNQTGTLTISVRLIIDCYHDTHYGSTQTDEVAEHIKRYNEVHRCLQGFTPGRACGLVRTNSQFYTASHGIKVYESTYTCEIKDEDEPPTSVQQTPIKLNVKLVDRWE
ncbi:MAG: hypothetical protein MJZ28_10235 [Paludibacteraceae bacterium]|nr:hypothetical protein [Paludibacteraceae bacterium]